MHHLCIFFAVLLAPVPAWASQDWAASAPIDAIVDEGSNRSEVMRIAQYLTDVIGPRLTNSPGARQAEDWTADKFREWGLSNIRKEGVEFGRGWSNQSLNVRMITPREGSLTAAALAWTPGTNGEITAPVVYAPLTNEAAFARYRGKLKGSIVLISEPAAFKYPVDPPVQRLSEAEYQGLGRYEFLNRSGASRPPASDRVAFAATLDAFLKAEGAVAFVTMSNRNNKLLQGNYYSGYQPGPTPATPGFELAAEDYRRLTRLLDMGLTPSLRVESSSTYHEEDSRAYTILADLPGTDRNAGYVMAGAHLDSWATGDGAADNAAGVAMVMEAARIIKAIGVKPRRTIRLALWAGEEQGLLGSFHYVQSRLATRRVDAALKGSAYRAAWNRSYPITPGPDHGKLSAYFNLDNGGGKIRGINTQGNLAAMPIFQKWFAPFEPMDGDIVVARRSVSTDHIYFDAIGIPAFQFIQDRLDYVSTVHHTNVDTFDHLQADDLRQSAIILAATLINTANAPDLLPRIPMPTAPNNSAAFYSYQAPKSGEQ